MLTRRSVLAATAGGLALTATPAVAGENTVKSLVDAQAAKLTQYDTVGIGAFKGRQQYSVKGDAIFQIGSITKTFTALALAIADRGGQLSIDDPLAKHLPRRFPAPREVKLQQLSSHISGMPQLPPGLLEDPALDWKDPYAHLTEEKLIAALRNTTLVSRPGTTYMYSNYGAGLLGLALSRNYEALVRHRITLPLGLRDTTTTLNRDQRHRKVQGYDQTGVPTPDWTLPMIPGAGALYGTVDDLLRYQRAHLGEAPRSLKPALDLVQQARFTIAPGFQVGLGWHMTTLASGQEVVFHDGGTGGFSSIAGFSRAKNAGVAIIANKFAAEVVPHALELLDSL
ncbi:MAG: serine hydrolase domain-containing protein [Kibdelosporangium sp.]